MSPHEVVCVGLATADTIVVVASWPEPDGRAVAEAIVRGHGGPAATAAVTLARMGHTAAVAGAVGDDASGSAIRAALAGEGVDVSLVRTADGPSAESVVVVERAHDTRTILHAPGPVPAGMDGATRHACGAARWVHADHAGIGLVIGTVEPGRLSLDLGHAGAAPALDGVGLYAPSRAALLAHTGAATVRSGVRRALDAGARRVAVTLGNDGAIGADTSGTWLARPPRVTVASTVGAGDVFHGALLAGLLEERPLPDALHRATVAAALSCRSIDGRGAIPRRAELEGALATTPDVERITLEGDR